jgi:hypothetical protein
MLRTHDRFVTEGGEERCGLGRAKQANYGVRLTFSQMGIGRQSSTL